MDKLIPAAPCIERLPELERAVDRLLIEHLLAADDFRSWVLTAAGVRDPVALRSVLAPLRQSGRLDNGLDIGMTLKGGSADEFVLISNRLLPELRHARAARDAAQALRQRHPGSAVHLVLVRAESAGSGPDAGAIDRCFDSVLLHDHLKLIFEGRAAASGGELARRLDFHATLLGSAIEASARAALQAPRVSPDTFLQDYILLLQAEAPELPPGVGMIASRSVSEVPLMVFGVGGLPDWSFLPPMRLAHHLREGTVSLTFYGWGRYLEELATVMDPVLSRTPFQLALSSPPREGAQPGLMIVDEVPTVDPGHPVAQQAGSIVAGLRAADRLRRWFAGQRSAVRLWAEIAGGVRGEEKVQRFRRDLALS